jgi:hypothetical protein
VLQICFSYSTSLCRATKYISLISKMTNSVEEINPNPLSVLVLDELLTLQIFTTLYSGICIQFPKQGLNVL